MAHILNSRSAPARSRAKKARVSARRRPVQARSAATVRAILDAAARVLATDGYDRTSTNRVAERAGVSIGSLYQYFPNKEALVAALIDEHRARALEVFLARACAVQAAPLAPAVRAIVEAVVDVHELDPRLHRVLTEQVPRLGGLAKLLLDLDSRVSVVVRALLEARRAELGPRDLDAATFVVVHAVESLVHRAVLDRRLGRDALVDETTALVVGYLARA